MLAFCDQRRVVPLVSRPVLAEYRTVLSDPEVALHYPHLNALKIEAELARLAYIGDMMRELKIRCPLPRDPKDSKFIELAIAGNAGAIVTCDRDLLDLSVGHDLVARRFRQRLPGAVVIRPDAFVRWVEALSGTLN